MFGAARSARPPAVDKGDWPPAARVSHASMRTPPPVRQQWVIALRVKDGRVQDSDAIKQLPDGEGKLEDEIE